MPVLDKVAVGVDIGGTTIKAGIVSAKNGIIKTVIRRTEPRKSAKAVVGNIVSAVEELGADDSMGIGMGIPGPLDMDKGILHNPHRFPKMNGYNIKRALEKKLGREIVIDNDANCFALAEKIMGAGKDYRHVVAITLGTGLGCGVIINNRLLHGATSMAAEIALNPYLDNTLEHYTGKSAIMRYYRDFGGAKQRSVKEIAKNAKSDAKARQAFRSYGKHLGRGISPAINLLDPELLVLGGGIAKNYGLFRKEFEANLRKNIHCLPAKKLKIAVTKMGNDAGMAGAAALVHYSRWRWQYDKSCTQLAFGRLLVFGEGDKNGGKCRGGNAPFGRNGREFGPEHFFRHPGHSRRKKSKQN